MNTLFIVLVSILICIAFAFILPPFFKKIEIKQENIDERNIHIAREQLRDLKAQLNTGAISQTQYEAQRLELELTLSDALDIQKTSINNQSTSATAAYILLIAIPIVSGSLYATLGNFAAIQPTPEMLANNQTAPSFNDVQKMIEKTQSYLEKNPNDAQGWQILGNVYRRLELYPQAANAFEHAYNLLGDKPEIMLLYAESLAFANNEQLLGKPFELVKKALEIEPENPSGLWLAGMANVQQGNKNEAKKFWTQLNNLLPRGSESQIQTQQMLAKLDENGAKSVPPSTTKSVALNVEVTLSDTLKAQTLPDDVLFIYAQALSGAKMPLAITRKRVSDLPVKITLDDSMAMIPAMKVSHFSEVKLLARISKTGQAITQTGDLIGEIIVKTQDSEWHTISINRVVQ